MNDTTSTGWTPEQNQDLIRQISDVLVAGINRDPEGVGRVLQYVYDTYGSAGTLGVCNGMAEIVRQLAFPNGGNAAREGDGMAVVMVSGGKPEALPADAQPHVWATRFVAAWVNGDHRASAALYVASYEADDAERFGDNVFALVAMAADVARNKEASTS